MLRRTAACLIAATVLAPTAVAYGVSGQLADPKGDFPDIVKLTYDNAKAKVVMTMTYNGDRGQNESFYLRWGSKGQSYQVFSSPSAGLNELRYAAGGSAPGKKVACPGLRIMRSGSATTTAAIPRTCLGKAPDAVRFQGIATEGLSSLDQTKVSKVVARG